MHTNHNTKKGVRMGNYLNESKRLPLKLTQAIFPKSQSNLTNFEWARVAPDKVVVATSDRNWLLLTDSINKNSRFISVMNSQGSIATTRKLLDGAIAAAKYAIASEYRPPTMTATRWVWRLAGSYHLTYLVPLLMEKAAYQFASAGRSTLAQWATEKAKEEKGHELLALRDIQSMGYDPEAVVGALIPSPAIVLMDYFTRSAQALNPIDCVGYSYTMERLALGIDEQYIQKIEDLLEPGVNATRCLRTHSSVGADVEHVEETVAMVAELTPSERVRIARACYETALMCFSPPSDGYISDAKLQQILKPLEVTKMQVSNS